LSGKCEGERQKTKINRKLKTNPQQKGDLMENKTFMTVEEVAKELSVSKSFAYKVVRELNTELKKLGYLTVAGRVNANYFRKKVCYNEQ
jgi:hypothetical protein